MKLFESGFGLREVKTAGLARAYRLGETPRSVWYTVRSGEFLLTSTEIRQETV